MQQRGGFGAAYGRRLSAVSDAVRTSRSIDGLHVVEAGEGSPVLFLHGIGSSAASFGAQLDAFADRYHVLAWDAPGYAGSEDRETPPGMDGYADAAARVLDTCGAVPAHVVGTSWGGVIAVRMALRHPGHVRSLVLADSTRGSGSDATKAAAMRKRPDELAHLGAVDFAAARAQRLLSPNAPDELVARVARGMAEAIRLPGYAHAAEAMAETDHGSALAGIDVPTLVLVGDHDRVTPPEESRRIAAAIPRAEFDILGHAGHLSHMEQPDAFNHRLERFLGSVEMAVVG